MTLYNISFLNLEFGSLGLDPLNLAFGILIRNPAQNSFFNI